MRRIRITKISATEILIRDDEAFVMRLSPTLISATPDDFIGLRNPDQWWLKLFMERGLSGYNLWFRQEPRESCYQRPQASIVSPIGTFIEWNDETHDSVALANQYLGTSIYAVAWFEASACHIGALTKDVSWITPPDRVVFQLERVINDRETFESVKTEAQAQARRLGIDFVENLDPEPV